MATTEEIKSVIADLQPGLDIVITMRDGSEVRGIIQDADNSGSSISLEGSDQADINASQIKTVSLEVSSESPE